MAWRTWAFRAFVSVIASFGVTVPSGAQEDRFFLFDPEAYSATVTLENRGDDLPDDLRLTGILQHGDFFGLGHTAYLGYQTAPDDLDGTSVLFGGYSLPLRVADELGAYGYISNQDFTTTAGVAQSPFSGTFEGSSGSVFYRWNLQYDQNAERILAHDLRLELQALSTQTAFDEIGEEFTASLNTLPIHLGYEFELSRGQGLSGGASLTYIRNLAFGPFDEEEDYTANRLGADPDYDLLRLTGRADYVFENDWFLSGELYGQYAGEPLISPFVLPLGGTSGVRALEEGEAFGDTGLIGTLQLFTPAVLANTPARSFLVGFIDAGAVFEEPEGGGVDDSETAVGIGVGIRWRGIEHLRGNADLTYLAAGSLTDEPGRETDDRFQILFSLTLSL